MQKLCCVRTIQQSSASLDYLSQAYQPVSPSILSHFRWELYHCACCARRASCVLMHCLHLMDRNHIKQLRPVRDFINGDGLIVAHPFVAVQFYADCLEELVSIVGLHRLVPIKYVRVSCCSEGYWVL